VCFLIILPHESDDLILLVPQLLIQLPDSLFLIFILKSRLVFFDVLFCLPGLEVQLGIGLDEGIGTYKRAFLF
jgi:hypothetical protein